MNQATASQDAIRIVIADRDHDNAAACKLVLSRLGHSVSSVGSGEQALRSIRELQPDLVLVAPALSDMNGLDLCRSIKADAGLAAAFVVLHGGDRQSGEDGGTGLAGDFDFYIGRSQGEQALVIQIKSALQSLGQQTTLRTQLALLTKAERELVDSRRAALNLVEDAVRAQHRLEVANAALHSEMTERTLAQARAEAASTELARRESELRLAGVVDAAMDAIISVDTDFRIVQFNRTAERMFGRKRADMLGQSLDCLLPQGTQASHRRQMQRFQETDITSRVMGENRILRGVRADGEEFPIEASSISQFGAGEGKVFTVILRDVTERQRSDEKLQRAAIVFNQAHDGIMITDADGVIQEVNEAFTRLFGFGRDEIVGRRHEVLQSSENRPGLHAALWDAIQTAGRWTGEIWSQRSNGESFSSMLDLVSVRDPGGMVQNLVAVYTDMTPFKEHQRQLQYAAHHDALTGLPNRALLEEFVRREITTAQRRGESLAVMLIGIDHFKNIGTTFGHHAVDALQVQLGHDLVAALREQDTVGRVAGEGFVLVLPGTDSDGAARLANKLLERSAQPYRIDEHEIFVTFSIGIAIYPDDAQDYDGLARCLLAAVQRARLAGRGNFQFFDPAMQHQEQEDLQIATALRLAIGRAELCLHYQPLVDLQTGRVGGLEALLRWQHPELGAVSPARFIPIAESSGLIRPIGQWVLRQACQDIRNWLDRDIDVPPIAVNVSPLQFRDADLVTRLQDTLKEFGIEGSRICIELTEGLLMVDVARSETMLRAIKALGIKLSLDDFGTGYSSLSYLKRFPIDKVKIDQSFVRSLPENLEDAEIARVVVSMAHGLGMRVVAEGVETEAQCRFLRDNVCDEIQGYLFLAPAAVRANRAAAARGPPFAGRAAASAGKVEDHPAGGRRAERDLVAQTSAQGRRVPDPERQQRAPGAGNAGA